MRVFVSSTYRDLATYREVLRLALEKSGHTFIGMEHFAAQDSPPLEASLSQLDTAEVYLGVVGNSYGSSPRGQDLSYTELEYNHATELGIPRLILVSSIEDKTPVGDHDPQRPVTQRLARFRQALMQSHTVDFFATEHEAAWKALAAISTLQARMAEVADQGAMQ
jgi:hypothetical protein